MKYVLLAIIFIISLSANAQSDSLVIPTIDTASSTLTMEKDTSKVKKPGFFSFLKEKGFSPKKSAFYSAVFPGGGQLYNRQYWKAPIALGGVGTAGYFVYSNTVEYRTYRDAYRFRVDGDSTTIDPFANNPNATDANLIEIRDRYRKWMEQSYIAVVVVYALQVLEAYTAAHLKNFDIDDDLSLQWQPTIQMPVSFSSSRQNIFNISSSLPVSNMELGIKMQLVRKKQYLIKNF
ncbi:MAG: DUF5683 domain-containing protein [Saprospiraceae bacterium]